MTDLEAKNQRLKNFIITHKPFGLSEVLAYNVIEWNGPNDFGNESTKGWHKSDRPIWIDWTRIEQLFMIGNCWMRMLGKKRKENLRKFMLQEYGEDFYLITQTRHER